MRRRACHEYDPALHRTATKRSSGGSCCRAEDPSGCSAIGNQYSGYTSPRSRPRAYWSVACPAGPGRRNQGFNIPPLVVREIARIPQVITIVFRSVLKRPHRRPPPRITPPPLNPNDSVDSRSFETDTEYVGGCAGFVDRTPTGQRSSQSNYVRPEALPREAV